VVEIFGGERGEGNVRSLSVLGGRKSAILAEGWRFEQWSRPMEYWLVRTGPESEPEVDGGLPRRRGIAPQAGQPVNAYVCTVDVPDLDSYVQRAVQLGAVRAVDKMPVPGIGWLAYLQDSEGNLLGMLQRDSSAADSASGAAPGR
jgi:predicted enzyme related to lactoylglutathione lyase